MVLTFEAVGGRIRRRCESPTMNLASSELPQGAYTTLRTYGRNRTVRLHDHVRRLTESIALQGGHAVLDEGSARHIIAQALRASAFPESRLRLTLAPPHFFVSVEPFSPLAPSLTAEGVRCATVPLQRENPKAKDTRFIGEAERAYQGLPQDAHEGLLVGKEGGILEGLSSNFFALRDDVLRTEEKRALHGVTRSLVLELAASVVPVDRTAVTLMELSDVAEAFLTSVSRGILPVVSIDDGRIGGGRPGPLTGQLRGLFEDLVEREAESVD